MVMVNLNKATTIKSTTTIKATTMKVKATTIKVKATTIKATGNLSPSLNLSKDGVMMAMEDLAIVAIVDKEVIREVTNHTRIRTIAIVINKEVIREVTILAIIK